MTVLALTGYAQSGKSTVSQYLVDNHGFTRVSFAAPLKQMLRTLDPIIGRNNWKANPSRALMLSDLFNSGMTEQDIKDSQYGPEYRRLLQVLGTDCVRAVQEDFWIRAAEKQMPDLNANYVFDDCRFPNEAEFIKGLSPEGLWNISRPGFEAVNGHISEQYAGKMGESVFIVNNRSLETLYADVDLALELAGYEVAA